MIKNIVASKIHKYQENLDNYFATELENTKKEIYEK